MIESQFAIAGPTATSSSLGGFRRFLRPGRQPIAELLCGKDKVGDSETSNSDLVPFAERHATLLLRW